MPTMISMISTAVVAVMISANANSQSAESYVSSASAPKSIQQITTSSIFLNNLNTTAMRHFAKNYGMENEESWTANATGTRARFKKEDALFLVDYDKKGNWASTIRIYNEKKLPKDIRRIVKSVYFDYEIVTITELTAPRSLLYFVKVQDANTLKTVRIVDGNMEEIEDFNRGDK